MMSSLAMVTTAWREAWRTIGLKRMSNIYMIVVWNSGGGVRLVMEIGANTRAEMEAGVWKMWCRR
jgi:hypothetical protein